MIDPPIPPAAGELGAALSGKDKAVADTSRVTFNMWKAGVAEKYSGRYRVFPNIRLNDLFYISALWRLLSWTARATTVSALPGSGEKRGVPVRSTAPGRAAGRSHLYPGAFPGGTGPIPVPRNHSVKQKSPLPPMPEHMGKRKAQRSC
ncbi:hypothetical protein [Deinococcus hopiensis]|uniref:Uncharacterized protein n=1 Tax=Deinococcus hopiensis KR-140 TaxID=695939 RepID=A0A1W1UU55_9DEIO|nr:hypothetical protein [Deinococcus hopiensis]SMB84603.1 hypothetical protein SAMN00790413_05211 [Deinococcus hopiensis KR-140]